VMEWIGIVGFAAILAVWVWRVGVAMGLATALRHREAALCDMAALQKQQAEEFKARVEPFIRSGNLAHRAASDLSCLASRTNLHGRKGGDE